MSSSGTTGGGTLVFLETRHQVFTVRSTLRRDSDSTTAVALSPEAMDALDQIGQRYVIPEDYCALETIREIGERNLTRTVEFCDDIDCYLLRKMPALEELPAPGLARTHFYDLKTLTDAVGTRTFRIRRILESENPSRVKFFHTRPQRVNDDLDFDNESVYSLIIPLVCGSLGIAFTSLGTVRVSFPSLGIALWKRVIYALVGRETIYRTRHALSVRRPRIGNGTSRQDRRKLLVIYGNPELLKVVRRCREDGMYDFTIWSGLMRKRYSDAGPLGRGLRAADSAAAAGFAQEARGLWKDVQALEKLQEHFVFDGIDCWPLVESRIQHLITEGLPATFGTWMLARSLFQCNSFALVTLSAFRSANERAVSSAARSVGVPVIIYQHGGARGWRPLPIQPYEEGQFVDYFMAYGEGAAQDFVRTTPRGSHQPRSVPIGSCALDVLSSSLNSEEIKRRIRTNHRLDPEKKTILYVLDNFGGNRSTFPNYYPDTWYYAHQKNMVNILGQHPEFQCLVKLAPGYSPSPLGEYTQRLSADHIRIVPNGRFQDLLPVADAIIIDYPSTTLVEALVTTKPVLVLTDARLLPFDESAMELLKKRARMAYTPTEFVEMVREFLADGSLEDDISTDTEFLRMYGTHLGDGRSLDRAVAWIHEQASSHRVQPVAAPTEGTREI